MKNSKKVISISTGLALAASMALALPVLAQVNANMGVNTMGMRQGQDNDQQGPDQQDQGYRNGSVRTGMPGMIVPGIFGTVTAVNGNSITINGRQGFGSTTAMVSYTVDATNATVKKDNAMSSISSVVVGDTIAVQGTVTGTNVVATAIFDGVGGMRGPGMDGRWASSTPMMGGRGHATSTPPIQGDGQPVVAGKVSAVNGTSLTIITSSNVTYTIDASSAKILKGPSTTTVSNIVIGDTVLIQGTINGTSVIASSVIDQAAVQGAPASSGKGQSHGFFGGIGSFFMHLFGF